MRQRLFHAGVVLCFLGGSVMWTASDSPATASQSPLEAPAAVCPAWQPMMPVWQCDLHGPALSGQFGSQVQVLPSGNIVVSDPAWNSNVGAVYLYNGKTGALISTLTGSQPGDAVGRIFVLANGNFLVVSNSWANGSAISAGAVTWGSQITGVAGVVSPANSLVGSQTSDLVGFTGDSNNIRLLSNGNYIVVSPYWASGAATGAGAVTWGNGTTGVRGAVSAANSLVGSQINDSVGYGGVTLLANGNYVVNSYGWRNGATVAAGAVTWGNGATGITGTVSPTNSLVGSHPLDQVGSGQIFALTNGNYVVASWDWNNGAVTQAGAVTWGNGAIGITGTVSAGNSLVGSHANDEIGNFGGVALSDGNYVVLSPFWTNGAVANAGAVTWGNGATGIKGVVSAVNSLVGSHSGDMYIGGVDGHQVDVIPLANSNYLVSNASWANGALTDAGAVTWASGITGITGTISSVNSLVGGQSGEYVGDPPYSNITPLANGNYVVSTPLWANGTNANAGAVTWGNGLTGITGTVSAANSLVGSHAGDGVGGVTTLSNGNYVVSSPGWANGAVTRAGAVTWGNGATGIRGAVAATNSLVGSHINDQVGSAGVWALNNANYVVDSPAWASGVLTAVGAVTWGSGTAGITGVVSVANSLIGSHGSDQVGIGCDICFGGITALGNGNYVVASPRWANGTLTDAGAVTWGNGATGITGVVTISNSLAGTHSNDQIAIGCDFCQGGVTPLSNGNYVVISPDWARGAVTQAGAVTWGNGATGITGVVTITDSLAGSQSGDRVGSDGVFVLSDGDYAIDSSGWANGAGAITWASRTAPITGAITMTNSVMGMTPNNAFGISAEYDSANMQLVVGRPADNIVTLYRLAGMERYVFVPYTIR